MVNVWEFTVESLDVFIMDPFNVVKSIGYFLLLTTLSFRL